jgi:protein-S-isoprenylcysteine O-methyltransferase Ste14
MSAAGRLTGWLRKVPLPARMGIYGSLFLALTLAGLPTLAYRIDLAYPQWHLELACLRIAGVLLFIAALAMYCWSSYLLTHHGRGAYVEFDPPAQLVVTGPFRWMRNPIAASVVLMLLGEAIALSSTGIFLLFLLAIPLAHLQATRIEEPRLAKRFGPAYLDYRRQVPRWLPRKPRD